VDNGGTESIERAVVLIIDGLTGRLPPEQLLDFRELAQAGEPGVALENLCTQIFEYDVMIEPEVLTRIQDVGQLMKLNPKYWERLNPKGNA